MDPAVAKSIREHVEAFFAGHRVTRREFSRGPIQRVAPGFHVLAVDPGPKTSLCTYVSVGGSLVRRADRPAMEFMVIAKDDRAELVERLAMVVHYWSDPQLEVLLTVVTLRRLLAFAFAGLALYFAYSIAMELFIAWYSGVDREISTAQRVWMWVSIVVLLLAAVVVVWPAPFREP